MRVRKVHFNHDSTSATCDAINLLHDGRADLDNAEWSDGLCRKPVAYARSAVRTPVTIKVSFSDGPPNGSLDVCAVAGAAPSRTVISLPVPDNDRTPGGGSPLGNVKPRSVRFDEFGNSEPIVFEVSGRPDKASIGKWAYIWTWYARPSAGAHWSAIMASVHLVYILLGIPNPPWTLNPSDPDGWSLPLDSAIDKACEWAAGATSMADLIAAIARGVYEHTPQHYTADNQLVTIPIDPNEKPLFHVTEYLDHLKSGADFAMNCRDVASAVMTFANLLGADLWPLGISRLNTQPVRAIGEKTPSAHSWGFHEVTVTNQSLPVGFPEETAALASGPDETVQIYDACLLLPGDVEPYDMPFGSVPNQNGYRFALIDGSGGDFGSPSRVRHRRKVI